MHLVYVVITLGGLIVLVNMLIAIMADTFSRVQSNVVIYDYRERLRVIIDLESVLLVCNRKRTHRLNIGLIRRPGGFEEEQGWQGSHTHLTKLTRDAFRRLTLKLEADMADMEARL